MIWESHPLGLRIDKNAERPSIVGSEWVRRVPAEGDDPWNSVRIAGLFECSETIELCLQPLTFGQPTMTSDAEDFVANYRRADADADDPGERIESRLREVQATST